MGPLSAAVLHVLCQTDVSGRSHGKNLGRAYSSTITSNLKYTFHTSTVCTATCSNCWTDTCANWCHMEDVGEEQKGYHIHLSGVFFALRPDLLMCDQCALLRVQQVKCWLCMVWKMWTSISNRV